MLLTQTRRKNELMNLRRTRKTSILDQAAESAAPRAPSENGDNVPAVDRCLEHAERYLRLDNVSKYYPTRSGPNCIFEDVSLDVGFGERVGVLGRNGAGKSTMIRLISGAEQPTSGAIHRSMSVSWPLAFGGAFQSSLTGYDNLRFICRIYNVSYRDKLEFVEDFSELGRYLREPVRTYSSGMRARLAFAISMVVEFDCFLIDEIIAVGDARFTEKCHNELFEKRGDRAMIIVSHSTEYIKEHCNRAVVLSGRKLHHFENIDEAYQYYGEHQT